MSASKKIASSGSPSDRSRTPSGLTATELCHTISAYWRHAASACLRGLLRHVSADGKEAQGNHLESMDKSRQFGRVTCKVDFCVIERTFSCRPVDVSGGRHARGRVLPITMAGVRLCNFVSNGRLLCGESLCRLLSVLEGVENRGVQGCALMRSGVVSRSVG